MGLRDGHPEKEGVLVNLSDLVSEVKQRLARKAELDRITKQAEGLRVVGGTRGEVKDKAEEQVKNAAEKVEQVEQVEEKIEVKATEKIEGKSEEKADEKVEEKNEEKAVQLDAATTSADVKSPIDGDTTGTVLPS
jgi:histidyl-tRNA synthetase